MPAKRTYNFKAVIMLLVLAMWSAVAAVPADCAMRYAQRQGEWVSFVLDLPGRTAWVRLATSNKDYEFAFDFGKNGIFTMLTLLATDPAIRTFTSYFGLPGPGQPLIMRGTLRIDKNRVIPVIYNTTLEQGMAYMMVGGLRDDILLQCVRGKTLRATVDAGPKNFTYTFSLSGFTKGLHRAGTLYQSLMGNTIPGMPYF